MGDAAWVKSLKIAGMYAGVILGAGFASGQELNLFFVRFGGMGFWGFLVSGVIFSLIGWAVLEICRVKQISDYNALIGAVMGRKAGAVMKWVVCLFLFVLYATMIAAGDAALTEAFGLPGGLGVLLMSAFCFAALLFGLGGLIKINVIVAPAMVIGGILIGLYTLFGASADPVENTAVFAQAQSHWIGAAITYAAYNTMTAVAVLAAMGAMATHRKVAFWGGLLGGISMTVLGLSLALPLFVTGLDLQRFEIPLLAVMSAYPRVVWLGYALILLAAIYTTAACNAFAFIENIADKIKISKIWLKIVVTLCAAAASRIGFSTFVSAVYPLFGIFGLVQAVMIVSTFLWLKVAKF